MHEQLNFPYLRVINKARRNKWQGNADEWTAADWGNELAGEVGEACNVVKKIRRVDSGTVRDGLTDKNALIQALGFELADVIVCVDLLAMYYDIDLASFVIRKFNDTSDKIGLSDDKLAWSNSGYEAYGGNVRPQGKTF